VEGNPVAAEQRMKGVSRVVAAQAAVKPLTREESHVVGYLENVVPRQLVRSRAVACLRNALKQRLVTWLVEDWPIDASHQRPVMSPVEVILQADRHILQR
jgi:hypothetical protein